MLHPPLFPHPALKMLHNLRILHNIFTSHWIFCHRDVYSQACGIAQMWGWSAWRTSMCVGFSMVRMTKRIPGPLSGTSSMPNWNAICKTVAKTEISIAIMDNATFACKEAIVAQLLVQASNLWKYLRTMAIYFSLTMLNNWPRPWSNQRHLPSISTCILSTSRPSRSPIRFSQVSNKEVASAWRAKTWRIQETAARSSNQKAFRQRHNCQRSSYRTRTISTKLPPRQKDEEHQALQGTPTHSNKRPTDEVFTQCESSAPLHDSCLVFHYSCIKGWIQ